MCSDDSFLRPFTITLMSFVPDAPVSYTNGKVKSNNAWGISGNFLSCNSLYPTQPPINLCLTKTYYATTAFISKTSILIHFLWYTAPPHYQDILFMPKCVTNIYPVNSCESPNMYHFCLVHITNSSILNSLQMELKSNRLSSAAFLRNVFLPSCKVLQ